MKNFNKQLKAYGDEMKNARCPYSKAELDRNIRRAIWDDRRDVPPCTSKYAMAHSKRRFWPAAAAAIVAAIAIPTAIFASNDSTAGEIASVKVDGEKVYFACNNGCAVDETIETFKNLIK